MHQTEQNEPPRLSQPWNGMAAGSLESAMTPRSRAAYYEQRSKVWATADAPNLRQRDGRWDTADQDFSRALADFRKFKESQDSESRNPHQKALLDNVFLQDEHALIAMHAGIMKARLKDDRDHALTSEEERLLHQKAAEWEAQGRRIALSAGEWDPTRGRSVSRGQ